MLPIRRRAECVQNIAADVEVDLGSPFGGVALSSASSTPSGGPHRRAQAGTTGAGDRSKLVVGKVEELFHPFEIAGLHSLLEPAHALGAGAVGKGIGDDLSARLALKRV